MAPEAGSLYVCSTPIGNLGDITVRALDVLRSVTCIAAEDTRRTRILLQHYGIATPLTSLHEHNEEEKAQILVEQLLSGSSIALVSDAGTPLLSDPGLRFVRQSLAAGIRVIPVPGASALLAALVVSGLSVHPHYFGGFLPRKSRERRKLLESLKSLEATLVFYEVPHRLLGTLRDLEAIFPNRQAVAARELTKVYEEVVRGTPAELLVHFKEMEPRGEFVLLVEGASLSSTVPHISEEEIQRALLVAFSEGRSRKEAIAHVASSLGVPRNAVYRIGIGLDDRDRG